MTFIYSTTGALPRFIILSKLTVLLYFDPQMLHMFLFGRCSKEYAVLPWIFWNNCLMCKFLGAGERVWWKTVTRGKCVDRIARQKPESRPFPSSLGPLYQNEVKCSSFLMEMIFHARANETHFHKKGFALGLMSFLYPEVVCWLYQSIYL